MNFAVLPAAIADVVITSTTPVLRVNAGIPITEALTMDALPVSATYRTATRTTLATLTAHLNLGVIMQSRADHNFHECATRKFNHSLLNTNVTMNDLSDRLNCLTVRAALTTKSLSTLRRIRRRRTLRVLVCR